MTKAKKRKPWYADWLRAPPAEPAEKARQKDPIPFSVSPRRHHCYVESKSFEELYASLTKHPELPLIVGPWVSELGYEILYWIPFLTWLRQQLGKRKTIAISRGGVAAWYARVASHYLDIFDLVDPDTFRETNAARMADAPGNSQKHVAYDDFDHRMVVAALERLGRKRALLIHPSILYALFKPSWDGEAGRDLIMDRLTMRPFAPVRQLDLDLPERFVAAKFYARPSVPATPETQATVAEWVSRVADRIPVVSLSLPYQPDDHGTIPLPDHPNVIHVGQHFGAATNLADQSEVIARSEGLIGTYGGFSYLSLMYHKPSVGLVVVDKPSLAIHYGYAARLAFRMRTTCSVVHPETLRLNGILGA